jgi:DNA-binding PadR family transcriptional regulator
MLAGGQMHGYEIKKRLRRELGESADINFGSIYYGLKSFVAKGWVDHIRDEAVKGSPERSVYRITPRGRRQLKLMLEEVFAGTADRLDPLEAGLNFMNNLPPEEVEELLTRRYSQLKSRYEQALAGEAPENEPLWASLIHQYRLYRLGAEVLWLKNTLPRLKKP